MLFIDEIHRLMRVVEEALYPAMEDGYVSWVIDKGLYHAYISSGQLYYFSERDSSSLQFVRVLTRVVFPSQQLPWRFLC